MLKSRPEAGFFALHVTSRVLADLKNVRPENTWYNSLSIGKEIMMSNYRRYTRACDFNQLRPELYQAIQNHIQTQQLENIETELLMCCETTSEQKNKGGLTAWLEGNVDTLYYTGMLVTPQWLVWARHGDKSGTTVSAAKLKDLQVNIFTPKLFKDRGIEVFGYINNSKRRTGGYTGGYIGLGSEEAAQKFVEVVVQAIEETRPKTPPTKRRFFGGLRWF
jgi:hypothetical protein